MAGRHEQARGDEGRSDGVEPRAGAFTDSEIPGETPAVPEVVTGCKFHPRCEVCEERCRTEVPQIREIGPNRKVACHVARPDAS